MRKATYKLYSISYNGTHKENILSTSKKNVLQYIKENYTYHWTVVNGILCQHYYKTKLFSVKQIQKV